MNREDKKNNKELENNGLEDIGLLQESDLKNIGMSVIEIRKFEIHIRICFPKHDSRRHRGSGTLAWFDSVGYQAMLTF